MGLSLGDRSDPNSRRCPQLGAMALRLGLLLALLGCTTAPDPALEEAWEGWKSLHAKEYPGVGPATPRPPSTCWSWLSGWGGLTPEPPTCTHPIPCPHSPRGGMFLILLLLCLMAGDRGYPPGGLGEEPTAHPAAQLGGDAGAARLPPGHEPLRGPGTYRHARHLPRGSLRAPRA